MSKWDSGTRPRALVIGLHASIHPGRSPGFWLATTWKKSPRWKLSSDGLWDSYPIAARITCLGGWSELACLVPPIEIEGERDPEEGLSFSVIRKSFSDFILPIPNPVSAVKSR